jgi:hypothetical protein
VRQSVYRVNQMVLLPAMSWPLRLESGDLRRIVGPLHAVAQAGAMAVVDSVISRIRLYLRGRNASAWREAAVELVFSERR